MNGALLLSPVSLKVVLFSKTVCILTINNLVILVRILS